MKEKEILIRAGPMNTYEVYFEDGGEVPQELQQKFSSPNSAKKFIRRYLNKRRDYPARGRVKGKKNATGTAESDVQ